MGIKNLCFNRGKYAGRRTASLNEPMLTSLHDLLANFSTVKDGLESLDTRLNSLVRSERAAAMDFLL